MRVKVTIHDGQPKKPALIQCVCGAEALVNKIIEMKDAFVLITDNKNMDRLLTQEAKQQFALEGLEVQNPPEYEAAHTVLLRRVDSMIHAMSVEEIVTYIDQSLNVKKVVKIPNSDHLLKIVFATSAVADRVVQEGLQIKFQRFENKNIEEMFVPVVPCYRCYSYGHLKKYCPKPVEYKVCSNCAALDHVYTDCHAQTYKCINCNDSHRTLMAKCPVRKQIVRNKIKEKRTRSRSKNRGDLTQTFLVVTPAEIIKTNKLPENYLAVMRRQLQ